MRSNRSTAMRPTLVTSLLAATMLVGACSAYDSTSRKVANAITPYRINIVQGNFVSREAASQLREGMTRDQVRFLLGTPLLTDVFHGNRWDYVFSFRRGSTPVVQQRRYTVFFQDDKLVKFGGDELPSEYELIAEIDGFKAVQKNQTVGKILTGRNTDEPVAPKVAPAPSSDGSAPAPAPATDASAPAAAPAAASPQTSEAPAAADTGVVVKPVN
ncbi:outer membrane protein assembly factor BamE [Cupriavidus pauculus]|uniref:Outer membrane protein assembly factor BamE n=1 Tax=Cupriavidus pauculus TaxID=82633 RepID=A0A5P2GZ85_9BURK|nr:outer membrane protein assembly factor BamE [Cupriavidus pauculus]QET00635.1 outer membrane protein assembly factor BamE [Cupriavidus pauculus]